MSRRMYLFFAVLIVILLVSQVATLVVNIQLSQVQDELFRLQQKNIWHEPYEKLPGYTYYRFTGEDGKIVVIGTPDMGDRCLYTMTYKRVYIECKKAIVDGKMIDNFKLYYTTSEYVP